MVRLSRPRNPKLIANGAGDQLLDFPVARNRRRDSCGWIPVDGVARSLSVDDAAVLFEMAHQIATFHARAGRSMVSVSQMAPVGAALAARAR